MKILLLIDSLGAGGAQRQLVGLAVMLKRLGYDTSVATYYDNRFYVDTLLDAGVPYAYIKDAHGVFKRIWAVARYIMRVKPDWVISYLETPSIIASIVHGFNRNFKLIVSERNTTQVIGKNEKIRFNLYRFADYVVPNSYAQEGFILKNFPILKKKTVTIVNFVDTDYFIPIRRDRLSVPEIIIVASIWPPKNTLCFIEVVKKLKDKGLHFHISWYGKTNSNMAYFNECQQRIAQLCVSDCICLMDKTKKIREMYQNADFFVLPSFYEGTPNVICEAMACGLPVACSNVCDNPIYVRNGENGVLFDPCSVESMADAINELLTIDNKKYASYCRVSRSIAEEKLSKKKFVESYTKLIEA